MQLKEPCKTKSEPAGTKKSFNTKSKRLIDLCRRIIYIAPLELQIPHSPLGLCIPGVQRSKPEIVPGNSSIGCFEPRMPGGHSQDQQLLGMAIRGECFRSHRSWAVICLHFSNKDNRHCWSCDQCAARSDMLRTSELASRRTLPSLSKNTNFSVLYYSIAW